MFDWASCLLKFRLSHHKNMPITWYKYRNLCNICYICIPCYFCCGTSISSSDFYQFYYTTLNSVYHPHVTYHYTKQNDIFLQMSIFKMIKSKPPFSDAGISDRSYLRIGWNETNGKMHMMYHQHKRDVNPHYFREARSRMSYYHWIAHRVPWISNWHATFRCARLLDAQMRCESPRASNHIGYGQLDERYKYLMVRSRLRNVL